MDQLVFHQKGNSSVRLTLGAEVALGSRPKDSSLAGSVVPAMGRERALAPDLPMDGGADLAREPASARDASQETSPGERWYVVHTRFQCERGAVQQLNRQGFCTFLPLKPKAWRHARRQGTRFVPLFPRYLFVRLNLGRDRWRSVNGTFGVHGLVTGADHRPQPLPKGVVENLAAVADDRGCIRAKQVSDKGANAIWPVPPGGQAHRWLELDSDACVGALMDLLSGRASAFFSADQVLST
jgi:hypothetical protein